jgi:hypothetical protein
VCFISRRLRSELYKKNLLKKNIVPELDRYAHARMSLAMSKSDGRLRSELNKPERLENDYVPLHNDLCKYTMDIKDLNRWQVFLPCMHVHTHLQDASVTRKLYPHKKLLLPKDSVVH